MRRIKVKIQYLGTNYAGWQIQPKNKTIQGEIENAIFLALNEKCEVVGSGRTDAGVHAICQVAHFDTETKINPNKLFYVINKFLPDDIKILESCEVRPTFHARFNAKKKTYHYNFYCSKVALPFFEQTHAQIPYEFDILKAQSVLDEFVGTHDFKAFCSSGSNVKDTIRTIYGIKLWQTGKQTFCLEVKGNGFLYNMVRIIAGTLIEVGCGTKKAEAIKLVIESKNRVLAGKTAPAKGLVLANVEYNSRIRKID